MKKFYWKKEKRNQKKKKGNLKKKNIKKYDIKSMKSFCRTDFEELQAKELKKKNNFAYSKSTPDLLGK